MRMLPGKITMTDLVAGIFIILFTYTAVNKLKDYATFGIALRQSPVLQPYAGFVLIAVPVAKLVAVILLVFSMTRKAGLYISWILMCMFSAYISYLLIFVPVLPCNCGGIWKSMSWKTQLTVNLMLLIILSRALMILKNNKDTIATDNRTSRTPA